MRGLTGQLTSKLFCWLPAAEAAGLPASLKDEKMKKYLQIGKSVLHDFDRYVAAASFRLLHLLNRVFNVKRSCEARRPTLPFTRYILHFVFCDFAGNVGTTLCLCTALNSSFAAIRRTTFYTASAFLLLPMQFW